MSKSANDPKPGHVNLKTLAEHLQLSQTTVSLVLNNSPSAKSIPQETRQRVLEAAQRLNYRPNYFARSLRQSRSMSVGVLAPDLSEGYFTRVMSGVVEELSRANYFYFTACHDWRPELMQEYLRMLLERAVDGFLLLNTAAELSVPVPVVAISAHGSEPNVTHIVVDHVKAVEMALRHLCELGHRRIAFMRGPKAIPDSEFRWAGVEQAAKKLGLTLDPKLIVSIDSGSWSMKTGHHPMSPEIGYHPMKQLLAKTRDFTAIFCFNDIAAIGAIRALTEEGLSVPRDVSIVGFDDIQTAAYSTPSLTTVRQPLNEMGKRGARLLLDRIANPSATELAAEVVMQPELVMRESTGKARA
ncbi:MAG TPA: LacI family DNA-binding transcriptional regulator [Acidobacteriaceae bacterium]